MVEYTAKLTLTPEQDAEYTEMLLDRSAATRLRDDIEVRWQAAKAAHTKEQADATAALAKVNARIGRFLARTLACPPTLFDGTAADA